MEIQKKIISLIGIGLLMGSTNLLAVEKSASSVIMNAYHYIDELKQYSFDAIVVDKSIDKGKVTDVYQHSVKVEVDRPNRLRVDIKGEFKNTTNYFDNGKFTMVDNDNKYYGQLKTPKEINKALDFIFDKYGIKAPLATLIYTNMGKRAKFKRSKYFGVETIFGVECDYVAFKNGSREVHIWIARGDKPIVKYYAEINKFYRIDTTIFWQDKLRISDNDFVFKASKDILPISVESAR